jgi:Dolichyl-phosphate-mannose-protein mannosyltransferase
MGENHANSLRYTRLNPKEADTESQLTTLGKSFNTLGKKMSWFSVALALACGTVMRLWMLKDLPQISVDTLLYGNIAKNILRGQFAITDGSGVAHATLIRLPGYPFFLALCFRLFGIDHYTAVSYVQIAMELAGCLLLAAFVRRIASSAAAHWTLWLAALCPFTSSYAVAPLTETPTLFAIALALWALARFHARPAWPSALVFTFAVSFAALLRPDGALIGLALAPALVARLRPGAISRVKLIRMGLLCALLALLPFGIWTARNWRVFHVFQPLAPRYATDPGESTNPGWQRWMKTWCLDFVSTYDIYWNVPDGPFDLAKLPSRAFDSPAQYAQTESIAAAYNGNGQDLSPEIDARFAQLAAERIKDRPLRYYLWLPLGRMADMWLRPRVENLNIDLDWWVYGHHYSETRFSWAYAALNGAYLLLALAGLCFKPRFWPWMVLYLLMRSALLTTIEAPEARYTLECFPMVFALAGIGVWNIARKLASSASSRANMHAG